MEGWQACLLSGLVLGICASQECQQGISVVAPDVAVPGHATVVLVTMLGARRMEPVNVTIRLVSDHVEETTQVLSETTSMIRGHGVLELDVPVGASGDYVLQTLANCTASDNCALQRSSALRLAGVVRDVVVRASRKTYRPGATVNFWVLALDYDLRSVSDVTGSVYLEDARGVNVALWQEVPLYEGVRSFRYPLSDAAALGRWQVKVVAEGELFSGQFDVSPTGGRGGTSAPEVAMAEEHYVELRFGSEMRRLYKPGLPFFGQVEAVSTEKSVRVRVKVYDNTTAIYSQDIEISSGEGAFTVPAILADSEVITLQAELVSVEGKEIDSHYVLAREPVYKWNSSSDCYLLVEGVEHTLQPGEQTRASVLSTCACERELHYTVVTDGLVTHWGRRATAMSSDSDRPPAPAVDGTAICRLDFSFEVKAVMAPTSHLLVYYLTDDGEPISDVVTFNVKLQHKQVSVRLEERRYWSPSEVLRADVKAEQGSVVCLVAGRLGNAASDRWSKAPQPRRSSKMAAASREQDFLEAGLSYYEQRCGEQREPGRRPDNRQHSRRRGNVVAVGSVDQLWLWTCYNYSAESRVSVVAPEDAGQWTLWALSLSPSAGLRFSPPAVFSIFRPLQLDFRLPFSLKVGETVEVDVRIGNNLDTCVDVTALLSLSEGAHFLSNTMLYVTEKLRLGPRGATSLVVRLVVTSSGAKNMTAEVLGYGSGNCQEASSSGGGGGATGNSSSLVGSVSSSASMLVHPEGLVQMDTESAYFCANENVVVSTGQDSRYEFLPAPRNRATMVFEVKAQEGVHVALSDVGHPSDSMYQLVVGDLGNTVSWIGRGMHGYGVRLASAETPGIVSDEEFRTFWLSWEPGELTVGLGPEPHNRTVLTWRADRSLHVHHVGFASTWGRPAQFRVWSYNDEAGFSQVLHLDVPRSLVPGTEQGTLLVSGGLALPMSARPGSMHYHCLGMGECTSLGATLSSFSPLLAPRELQGAQNDSLSARQLEDSLNLQLQLLLTFMKPDHSFGDHKQQGSHRNTVEVLLLLNQLQSRLSVDPGLVAAVRRWVHKRQAPDGSFQAPPADVNIREDDVMEDPRHAAFQDAVELTGETLAALVQVGLDTEEDSEVAMSARAYLERSLPRVTAPCPLAVTTHALALSRSEKLPEALERLQNASTNEEGDFGWQAQPSLERRPRDRTNRKSASDRDSATVEEYKASLYTLMAFSYLGDLKSAEPVARYLFYRSHLLDKHSEMLLLAVKAFSWFGALAADRHRSLTVSLATSGMELTDTAELRADTPAQTLQLPSLPTKVFVYATGAGCATVQGQVRYSTYAPARRSPILDLWAGVEDEVIVGHNLMEQVEGKLPLLKLKTCFRWKGARPSGVLRLEVTLFSGFQLESVSPAVLDSSGKMTRVQYGALHDNVWFVVANVSSKCAVCLRYSVQGQFPVSSLRPAFARVHPAGRADLGAETFFHTRRSSPLLAEVTDDDVITWFGSLDAGEPQLSSNFSDVCECGHVCSLANSTTSRGSRPSYHRKLHEATKTNSSLSKASLKDVHSSNVPAGGTNVTIVKPKLIKKARQNGSRIVDMLETRSNNTEQPSWGNNSGNISEEFKVNLKLDKTSKLLSEKPPLKSQNDVKKLGERREMEEDKGEAPTMHTVNKERRGVDTRPVPPTSEAREARNAQVSKFGKNEKLFVLDRDTLWGMLKEVVHVELDKNQQNNGRRKIEQ